MDGTPKDLTSDLEHYSEEVAVHLFNLIDAFTLRYAKEEIIIPLHTSTYLWAKLTESLLLNGASPQNLRVAIMEACDNLEEDFGPLFP